MIPLESYSVGRSVQDLIDSLMLIENKQAIVTVVVNGHSREVFYPVSIEDCPNYTTGARTYLHVT